MNTILTLCELCASGYKESFSVKAVPGKTTTEKKNYCENCKRKFSSPYDLRQYLISEREASNMIDVSRLGACCYKCHYVDLKVSEDGIYLGSDFCSHVTITCRHEKVCSVLKAEKEALSGENV